MAWKRSHFDESGQHEMPDPTPLALPVGFDVPESLESMIARMIVTDKLRQGSLGERDTFEEADDFGIDVESPLSVHQNIMTEMVDEELPGKKVVPEKQKGGDGDGRVRKAVGGRRSTDRPVDEAERDLEEGRSGSSEEDRSGSVDRQQSGRERQRSAR